ncbi:MAG TPA: pyridoxal phosphate-dependent aminotransferase family protein [Thermoguttaceae bacterium]|nr:pyridoxal phosphate-dependent aminotransferase family protein [Thermoguttaceae bacterium]
MPVMQSPPGPETVIDGRRYLYFSGTGYLGLQGHPEVIRAACQATEQYGIGSATSRAGYGDTPPLVEAERQAARLFGAQTAFYFMSGYVGNDVLARSIEREVDAVFVDECSHYCVHEAAARLAKPVHPFRHADSGDLAEKLRNHAPPGARPLVMSDGVFAALGTIAPVGEYCEILRAYPGSSLVIDDAHGLGVLGQNGRGTLEHAGLFERGVNVDVPGRKEKQTPSPDSPRLFLCGTLSKALGGYGGIIPGARQTVERMKSTSHYFAGASPVPVPVAAASARALQLAIDQPELRTRLWENVRAIRSGLREMGVEVADTPAPIISLVLGTAENMQRIHRELADGGILVPYKRTYSGLGPEGALRLAVFATHTADMIGRLVDELRRLV